MTEQLQVNSERTGVLGEINPPPRPLSVSLEQRLTGDGKEDTGKTEDLMITRKPDWLQREGIVYTGMWEPRYFQKMAQSGGRSTDATWVYKHSTATREAGQRLFGFNDFSRIRVPWFNRWNHAGLQRQLNVTVQKAWVQFKVESIRRALTQMVAHIKSKKPQALVEANAGKSIGLNTEYYNLISP